VADDQTENLRILAQARAAAYLRYRILEDRGEQNTLAGRREIIDTLHGGDRLEFMMFVEVLTKYTAAMVEADRDGDRDAVLDACRDLGDPNKWARFFQGEIS
jgi:hypothetical protein